VTVAVTAVPPSTEYACVVPTRESKSVRIEDPSDVVLMSPYGAPLSATAALLCPDASLSIVMACPTE